MMLAGMVATSGLTLGLSGEGLKGAECKRDAPSSVRSRPLVRLATFHEASSEEQPVVHYPEIV